MKNFHLAIISSLLAIIFIYIILFTYTFINLNKEFKYTFKSLENLNFHQKYSKKIHHIRDEHSLSLLFKKTQVEDLLFTTINKFNDKDTIVLFQGDSWMEQITRNRFKQSRKLIQKFGNNNKVGFINAGVSSYSPSLMNLQLDVLQKDFQIFPDIVIAYIDQTDIGDELCRYKNNKVYKNGILNSVQPEAYLMYKNFYNYSENYGLSKIFLNDYPKIIKTFQLINFKFKYSFRKFTIRFYRKYISSSMIDREKLNKCYWSEIVNYLIKPTKDDIKYFSNSINEYIKKINQKNHIKMLILVTFPHKKHFYKNSAEINSYTLNVSDVVDDVIKNKKNVTHINFSKILLNNKNFDYENIWLDDEIHLNPTAHGKLFIKEILEDLKRYLY